MSKLLHITQYTLDNLTLVPDYYTDREGGNWKSWPLQELIVDDFHLNQRSKDFVEMYGLKVHSLAFGNPRAGLGNFLRWDCINGFNLE